MGAIEAPPSWGNWAAFLLRRSNNQTPAPNSASPSTGPTTAPAIHALELGPGSEVWVEATGALVVALGIELADKESDDRVEEASRT
jgi:hypothetical protein